MKKIIFTIMTLCVFHFVNAQNKQAPQNAIKLNPLSLVFATGNISYERAVSDNMSIQLGGFYTGTSISGLKYSGLGITPEFRVYFAGNRQALNGVYAGPFIRYQSFTLEDKDNGDKADFTSFGGGAVVGWEKTWTSGFVLDIFAGPAYNKGEVKSKSGSSSSFDVASSVEGFGLRAGVNIGFGF